MEGKKTPEKIIVAYREKKKDHKISLTIFFVIAIMVLTAISVVCFTKVLTTVGIVCLIMALVFVFLIFIISKKSKIIERVNQYPKIAMIIYGPYLCIIRDQIEKIKLIEIEKVSKANDMAQGVLVRVRKSSGCICIKANGKNHNVYQIVNVDASTEAIKKFVKEAKSKQVIK